jgi:hypothetical protein
MELLTTSAASVWRRCPREYLYSYVLWRRLIATSEALRIGTLIHAALEAWWKSYMFSVLADHRPEMPLERALAALDACADELDDRNAIDEYTLAACRVLIAGYHARWSPEMAEIEVIGVESNFRAPMVNPATGHPSRTFEIGGKLDALILRRGRVEIVEHKTTTEALDGDSDYWPRLRMDSQISMYHDGAARLGHVPSSCTYDVIRKPTLRPYKATPEENRRYTKKGKLDARHRAEDETVAEYAARVADDVLANPERYYRRASIVRLDPEMAGHRANVWMVGEEIKLARKLDYYRQDPDSCRRFNRMCAYFDVCTGAESIESPRFSTVEAHPELVEAID